MITVKAVGIYTITLLKIFPEMGAGEGHLALT
jgi:hypothetical protein